MPYLGNVPAEAYSQMSYQDLTGGSGTSFTLDYPVGNENEIEVFVNNVRQEPTVAYTTAGTALTMTGTIAATDDFYVVFQGKAQQTIGIPEKQTNGTYLFGNAVTIDEDGATVLTVDRATSDGTIIDLQKDGTTVGSIGTLSDKIYIGSSAGGDTFLRLNSNTVTPANSSGADRDATINLGYSGGRFQNLFLSGGVYLGGTGSANHLDDYEEGSWTPGIAFGGTVATLSEANGAYTKVGRMVTLNGHIAINTLNGGSGAAYFTGLPFSVDNTIGNTSVEASGHVSYFGSMTTTVGTPTFAAIQGTTNAEIYNGLHSTTLSQLTSGYVGNGTNMRFSITYFTT